MASDVAGEAGELHPFEAGENDRLRLLEARDDESAGAFEVHATADAWRVKGARETGHAHVVGVVPEADESRACEASESEVSCPPDAPEHDRRRGQVARIMGASALAHVLLLGGAAVVRLSVGPTEVELVQRDYLVKLETLARPVVEAHADDATLGRLSRGASEGNLALERRAGAGPVVNKPSLIAGARAADEPHQGVAAMMQGPEAPDSGAASEEVKVEPVAIKPGLDKRASVPSARRAAGISLKTDEARPGRQAEKSTHAPEIVMLPGATTGAGRLAPEVLQRIVRQRFGSFRSCYDTGLKANPNLAGRVSVRFVIGRDGSVASVSNGGSDLPDSGVVSCVVRSFGSLAFPRPRDGVVIAQLPILFTTR